MNDAAGRRAGRAGDRGRAGVRGPGLPPAGGVRAAARRSWPRRATSRGRLGHEGGLVERDAMVFQAARRIAQLDAAHEGLVFGRLDMQHERRPGAALHRPDRAARREPRLAADRLARARGRRVLPGDRGRAPQASYAAGCCARTGPKVVGVEDELLDAEALAELEADALPIVGEGALMAQLSRARDRSMHSIVATIQAEQDMAIRAPGKGVVSISGGPGTGKTVVALHRAAYLLYTDRRRYEGGGVLVVGPSGVFMRYIERVLPEPRRDRGRAALARRGRRRRPRDPARRAGGGRRQGLGPDGDAAAADGAAAGARQPGAVPDLLARRRASCSTAACSAGPPPADVAGPAQPAAAAGRERAARRDVAPGPRRARPRPGPGGVRRRHALRPDVPRLRGRLVAAARRAAPCSAGCATRSSSPGSPTACSAPRSSGCSPSRGATATRSTCRSRTCR